MAKTSTQSIIRGVKREMKQVLRRATDAGWSISMTGGNHVRLDHPMAGRPVFAPLTAGGHFAHKRLLGDMKRALSSSVH